MSKPYMENGKTLLKFPIAGLVALSIAFIFNNALLIIGERMAGFGFDELVTPFYIIIASIVAIISFDVYDSRTITLDQVPLALLTLAFVSLIGALFQQFTITFEPLAEEGVIGEFSALILLLAYTFFGISVAERLIP